MAHHTFGPNAGAKAKGSGHPVMFGRPKPAADFGHFPEGGGYPHRFLGWAYELMEQANSQTVDPSQVLHLCSGSVLTGVRVDIRPEKNPDIVADCRSVPLPDESFDSILPTPRIPRNTLVICTAPRTTTPSQARLFVNLCACFALVGFLGCFISKCP